MHPNAPEPRRCLPAWGITTDGKQVFIGLANPRAWELSNPVYRTLHVAPQR